MENFFVSLYENGSNVNEMAGCNCYGEDCNYCQYCQSCNYCDQCYGCDVCTI